MTIRKLGLIILRPGLFGVVMCTFGFNGSLVFDVIENGLQGSRHE